MKKAITIFFSLLFLIHTTNYNLVAQDNEYFVMCAVFYDDDEALKNFMDKALEFKSIVKQIPDTSAYDYFYGKIPNNLKKFNVNTLHKSDGGIRGPYTLYIHFVPINVKNILPDQKDTIMHFVRKCLTVIALYDASSPTINEITNVFDRDNLLNIHNNTSWIVNDAIKFMNPERVPSNAPTAFPSSLEVYPYNISKLSPEEWDKRKQQISLFLRQLETEVYCLDNQWGCRLHREDVATCFRWIDRTHYFWGGNATKSLEPLVKDVLGINCLKSPYSYFTKKLEQNVSEPLITVEKYLITKEWQKEEEKRQAEAEEERSIVAALTSKQNTLAVQKPSVIGETDNNLNNFNFTPPSSSYFANTPPENIAMAFQHYLEQLNNYAQGLKQQCNHHLGNQHSTYKLIEECDDFFKTCSRYIITLYKDYPRSKSRSEQIYSFVQSLFQPNDFKTQLKDLETNYNNLYEQLERLYKSYIQIKDPNAAMSQEIILAIQQAIELFKYEHTILKCYIEGLEISKKITINFTKNFNTPELN